MENKLRVAVIGCGIMGLTHLYCYKELTDKVEVMAVIDGDAEKAKIAADINSSKFYTSAEECFKKENIDMLDVCLPTFLHTHYAVMAMEKGIKKLLLEKPVCSNLVEGKLLLETQKKTGSTVQVAQVVRFAKEYAYVKNEVASGKYGKIKSGTFFRFSAYPSWSPALMDWRKSGTVAIDLHIHDADYIRYLLGTEPDSVQSYAARDDEGVIRHIFTTYAFGDAVISSEGSWDFPLNYPFTADFQLNTEGGTFIYKNGVLTVYPNEGEPFVPEFDVEWDKAVTNHGNISNLEIYYLELKYFVDAFLGNAEPKVPLEDAVKTLELVYREIDLCGGMQKDK